MRLPASVTVLLLLAAGPALAEAGLPEEAAGASGDAAAVREARLLATPRDKEEPWGAFDTFERTYADLAGDPRPEIIAQNDDGNIYVLDRTGRVLASVRPPRTENLSARDFNGVAVADLDSDGQLDLLVPNAFGHVVRYEATPRGRSLALDEVWSHELRPMDAPATLADVEGDGFLEAFLQADGEPGQYALTANGTRLWSVLDGDGNAAAALADLEGDGTLEAIFATDGGRILVRDAATGALRASGKVPASPGSVPIRPETIDLDGDGVLEIVVAARNIFPSGDDWIEKSHAVVAAFRADGKPMWSFTADWLNPLVGARPAVHDVDGDGRLDLVYTDWNTPGHKPGNWEILPESHTFALAGDGRLLWTTALPALWSNRAPVVADVTGDAQPEILVLADRDNRSHLVLLGLDGSQKAWIPLRAGWHANRGAEPVDLDGDGLLELVIPIARDAPSCTRFDCREGALLVLDTKGEAARLLAPPAPSGRSAAVKSTGVVHGTVVGPDGAPVPNVAIATEGVTARTDALGAFALSLPFGAHLVAFDADGFAPRVVRVDLSGGHLPVLAVRLADEPPLRDVPPGAFAALALAVVALWASRRR